MVPVNDHVCNEMSRFGRFALPPIPLNYYEEARPGCLRPPEVCLYYLGFAVNRLQLKVFGFWVNIRSNSCFITSF